MDEEFYNELNDFFSQEDVQDAVNTENFDKIYQKYSAWSWSHHQHLGYIYKLTNFFLNDCKLTTNYIFNRLTSIQPGTFQKLNIHDIRIGGIVKGISGGAFRDMPLETVTIGRSCLLIMDNAFLRCPNIKTITIPPNVISIDPHAFDDCREHLTIRCSKNSYAEKYAQQNNINYQLANTIDEDLDYSNYDDMDFSRVDSDYWENKYNRQRGKYTNENDDNINAIYDALRDDTDTDDFDFIRADDYWKNKYDEQRGKVSGNAKNSINDNKYKFK